MGREVFVSLFGFLGFILEVSGTKQTKLPKEGPVGSNMD